MKGGEKKDERSDEEDDEEEEEQVKEKARERERALMMAEKAGKATSAAAVGSKDDAGVANGHLVPVGVGKENQTPTTTPNAPGHMNGELKKRK